jgi:hypothetical protein
MIRMEQVSEKTWLSLTKAASGADPEAQWELGYLFEYGAATKRGKILSLPNRTEAIKWYLSAAKQNHLAAKASLSNIYCAGDAPDYPAAITWAKSAILDGDASAAFNLGMIHRDLGKPKVALRYYTLAADMGDADAYLQIGLCCLLGHGTVIDYSAAVENFQRVLQAPAQQTAPRTREDALYWIALIKLMGLHKRRNLVPARDFLERANADGDHEKSNDILNIIGRADKKPLRPL